MNKKEIIVLEIPIYDILERQIKGYEKTINMLTRTGREK